MSTQINQQIVNASGVKLFIEQDGREVARAFLYVLKNGLHAEPFGLLEDVFVEENLRGQGIGTELVKKIIEAAKKNHCYKLIATSRRERPKVHALYEQLGFKNYGMEFRMEL